eukprot:5523331-Pyramimonas_sp.AAC.1
MLSPAILQCRAVPPGCKSSLQIAGRGWARLARRKIATRSSTSPACFLSGKRPRSAPILFSLS